VSSVVEAEIVVRPLAVADLADLAVLFDAHWNTRHCWCMAPCRTRSRFAVGWFAGGNRRAFEAGVTAGGTPMGLLASIADEPVGWCACGPRSRYVEADRWRGELLRDRDPGEDDAVWLLACLFVRSGSRGQGISYALIRAAVDLAARTGAVAVEGWPGTASDRGSAEAFLGRETAFERLGFAPARRPRADRVIMRRELGRGTTTS